MQKIFAPFALSALSALAALALLVSTPLAASTPWIEPQGAFAWVQYGADGRAWARTATTAAECPPLELTDRLVAMQVRARPSAGFPRTVCEAPLPEGATGARIEGVALPVPREPKRILLLGDTGCRIKRAKDEKGGRVTAQACNEPGAWPFARLSAQAARLQPDLVIHLGDYLYREVPCPASAPGCAGSPSGDAWPTWVADLLEPAQPLLRAAPWVFVRGNHESCERGGRGWFALLDAQPSRLMSSACSDRTAAFRVPLGRAESIAVLDSSDAKDSKSPADDEDHFKAQLDRIGRMRPAPAWIVTHKPFWAPEPKREGADDFLNHTLNAAAKKHLPESVAQVFAGHIHAFELLQFREPGPLQWVVGNGGTLIDKHQTVFEDMELGHKTVARGESLQGFGYLVLDRRGPSDWEATAYDADGTRLKGWACRLDFKYGPSCR